MQHGQAVKKEDRDAFAFAIGFPTYAKDLSLLGHLIQIARLVIHREQHTHNTCPARRSYHYVIIQTLDSWSEDVLDCTGLHYEMVSLLASTPSRIVIVEIMVDTLE